MALEDACVFAKCVASSAGIPTALGNYARERQPRTTRLQHEARQLGNLYHARGFMALARNTALRCLGPERALERNRWIYEWKP
jgi:salicylate hydroxylase